MSRKKTCQKKRKKWPWTHTPGSIGGLGTAPGRVRKGTFRVRRDSGKDSVKIPNRIQHANTPVGYGELSSLRETAAPSLVSGVGGTASLASFRLVSKRFSELFSGAGCTVLLVSLRKFPEAVRRWRQSVAVEFRLVFGRRCRFGA